MTMCVPELHFNNVCINSRAYRNVNARTPYGARLLSRFNVLGRRQVKNIFMGCYDVAS